MMEKLSRKIMALLIVTVLLMIFAPNLAYAANGLEVEISHEWTVSSGSYTNAVAASDIDGDGITEIVTAGYLYNSSTTFYDGELNIWNWNGTTLEKECSDYYYPHYTLSTDTRFNAVALGNVDNETDIEIVMAGYGKLLNIKEQGLIIIASWNGTTMNRKTGAYWPTKWLIVENETVFFGLAIGDVDKDDVKEIIAVGYQNMTSGAGTGFHGALTIWNVTEGDLVLEAEYTKLIGEETIWRAVSIDDVDNDGETEIIIVGDFQDKVLNHRCATLRICTWNGSTLNWKLSYQWYTYSETYANAVTTGDLDSDGISEIITIGHYSNGELVNAQLRVWSWRQKVLTLKASAEIGRIEPPALTLGTAVAISDVDLDKKNEIVVGVNFWILLSTAHIKIFAWNGETLVIEDFKDWEDASYIQNIVINDVDNDGTNEIITAGYSVSIWLPITPKSNLAIWSVTKTESSITVEVTPSTVVIGNQVTIRGYVMDETGDKGIPNLEVTIMSSREPLPVFTTIGKVRTNENGEYAFTWIPPAAGEYTIMVSWDGNYEHKGATATTTLTVEKASSMITLTLSSYTITIGEEISVSGTLYPAKTATIIIEYTNPQGIIPVTKIVISNETGFFSTTFTANQTGTWTIKAKWNGDENHKATESAPATLTVTKIQSALTIAASALTVNVNENVTITGTLTPGQETIITLTYVMPNGTAITRTVASTSAGTYTDTIKLGSAGVWQIKAKWNGNEECEATESTPLTVIAQIVDPLAQTFAITGLGLSLIAIILALVGVYMASRKKPTSPPAPQPPTQ